MIRPGERRLGLARAAALAVAPAADGTPVAVLNLLGSLFLDVAGRAVRGASTSSSRRRDARRRSSSSTSTPRRRARRSRVARWLDGRVTAVIGTHTHVQTSDARVQPGGTAAITDAGMTGPHDSVIGVEAELAIRRMRTGMPVRFRPAEGGVRLEGVVVDCDADGRALRRSSRCASPA